MVTATLKLAIEKYKMKITELTNDNDLLNVKLNSANEQNKLLNEQNETLKELNNEMKEKNNLLHELLQEKNKPTYSNIVNGYAVKFENVPSIILNLKSG